LFIFTKIEQGKTQVLLNSWKLTFQDIQHTIENTTKGCYILWNYVDELLDKFGTLTMDEIYKGFPSNLSIVEVEKNRDESKKYIDQLTEVIKDTLDEYLIQLFSMDTTTYSYIKTGHRELKQEIFDRVYDGELQI
jgi:hypothetical protein